MADGESGARSWWATLPGVLTALAALITAVGGVLALLAQQGIWPDKPGKPGAAAAPTPVPAAAATLSLSPSAANVGATPSAAATSVSTGPVRESGLSALPYKAVRVTALDRSVTDLLPSAEIYGTSLDLENGQRVDFEKLVSIDIEQPWDGRVRLTLVNGTTLQAVAANRTLAGRNELGQYMAGINTLRRIEFVR